MSIKSKKKCKKMNRYQHIPCLWVGDGSEILRAPHPFQKKGFLFQCPGCKGLDCMFIILNEENKKK